MNTHEKCQIEDENQILDAFHSTRDHFDVQNSAAIKQSFDVDMEDSQVE